MSKGLADYARMYLSDKTGFADKISVPVLLWEAQAGLSPADEQWNQTESGLSPRGVMPRPGEPRVFELLKVAGKKNPFAMGVTIGRIETNDIVIDDVSISRFHAYFQQDPKTKGWWVVDAESKNGVLLNGLKLAPNKKTLVPDNAKVRIGEIDLVFLTPKALVTRIELAFK